MNVFVRIKMENAQKITKQRTETNFTRKTKVYFKKVKCKRTYGHFLQEKPAAAVNQNATLLIQNIEKIENRRLAKYAV